MITEEHTGLGKAQMPVKTQNRGKSNSRRLKSQQSDGPEFRLLNLQEIAARRIPIEEALVAAESKGALWVCEHCKATFQSESRFMRHSCKEKRRAELMRRPLGQSAYAFYCTWMKMRKFSQQSSAAFMESRFYQSFINFAELVVNANIARTDKFIEIMVDGEVQPPLWCSPEAYSLYTAWHDSLQPPLQQVEESITYLIDIADREGVKLDDIFEHLGAQRILSFVRQRRLSPWFLFCSTKFSKTIKSLDPAHLKAFDMVINSNYWGQKFQESKATVAQIKEITKELNL